MPGPDFLDTNVFVYAYDIGTPDKQRTARALLRRAIAGEFVISTQVLAELATTLLHKVKPPVGTARMKLILDALAPIKVLLPDAGMLRRAIEAREMYKVHLYDGMIIAAAEAGECERIWSEDLNSGQKYFGVTVKNPFA